MSTSEGRSPHRTDACAHSVSHPRLLHHTKKTVRNRTAFTLTIPPIVHAAQETASPSLCFFICSLLRRIR